MPWTEDPGGLQSLGLQRVRHDWAHTYKVAASFSVISVQNSVLERQGSLLCLRWGHQQFKFYSESLQLVWIWFLSRQYFLHNPQELWQCWFIVVLEKEMATHSSILAWRIPLTEEPGRLQSMRSQGVGHNWSNLACIRQILHYVFMNKLLLSPFHDASFLFCSIKHDSFLSFVLLSPVSHFFKDYSIF